MITLTTSYLGFETETEGNHTWPLEVTAVSTCPDLPSEIFIYHVLDDTGDEEIFDAVSSVAQLSLLGTVPDLTGPEVTPYYRKATLRFDCQSPTTREDLYCKIREDVAELVEDYSNFGQVATTFVDEIRGPRDFCSDVQITVVGVETTTVPVPPGDTEPVYFTDTEFYVQKEDDNYEEVSLVVAPTPTSAPPLPFVGLFVYETEFLYVYIGNEEWRRTAVIAHIGEPPGLPSSDARIIFADDDFVYYRIDNITWVKVATV